MRERQRPGNRPAPAFAAETLHFLGEVEVIFALWGLPLVAAIMLSKDWQTAVRYLNDYGQLR